SFGFLNEGTISSSDIYEYQYEFTFYTEPENVTREKFAWIEEVVRPYLYQKDPTKPLQCNSNPLLLSIDLPGADFLSIIPPSADLTDCNTLCCTYRLCPAWSYSSSAASDFNNCKKEQPCCYLKTYIPASVPNRNIISATMNRTFPYNHPPTGLRSVVPLGGITTGSIELRGDGTFHEWTIENQSPAAGAKYGVVDNALLAIRLKNLETNETHTRLLRTHSNHNFNGIDTIRYYGSYPISDLNRSMTPAIIYSLNIENPNDYPIAIDFMYNVPLSVQIDQTGLSKIVIQQIISNTYIQCISWIGES
ncbi:unnamed protein product, partial [Rotaria sp. Silwood2]